MQKGYLTFWSQSFEVTQRFAHVLIKLSLAKTEIEIGSDHRVPRMQLDNAERCLNLAPTFLEFNEHPLAYFR